MWKNMSIKSQLVGVIAGIVLLLIVFSVVVWIAVGTISDAAVDMGRGKDVVADILPPPLYVIEAELTVLQLQAAKAEEVQPLMTKLVALKKDYDDRNAFWEKEALDPAVKKVLLGEQKQAADRFWKLALGDFATAIKQGDQARSRQLAGDLNIIYDAHRNGVDATVKSASTYADSTLSSLDNTAVRERWLVFLLACGGALLVALTGVLLIRKIVHSLNAAQQVAGAIAAGDLDSAIDTSQQGEIGVLLCSMKAMQDSLRGIVGEIKSIVEEAAVRGSFNTKMNMDGKAGYTKDLSELLNQLSEVTGTAMSDVSRVVTAMAHGDLTQKITKEYPGLFGQTAQGVNGTVKVLGDIVTEIQFIALSAGQGDFSTKLDLNGKVGFEKTLSELMNQLSDVTESGLLDIIRVAKALAAGDLTQSMTKDYPGLFDMTKQGINATVSNLKELVGQIKGATDTISTASKEIASGNSDLSQRTEEQASSLEETASSMEELDLHREAEYGERQTGQPTRHRRLRCGGQGRCSGQTGGDHNGLDQRIVAQDRGHHLGD